MDPSAVIFGCSGPKLSAAEKAFFRDCNPWAFILFARNVETPDQIRRLTSDLRGSVGRDALIFIDQEGGRVQRLRAPQWRNAPSAARFGELYAGSPADAKRAIWLNYRLIADELKAVGVDANCAPVLDLPTPDADPIISDRAFSSDPDDMIDMAHAAMAGLTAGGVAPVIKHIPGHGRADVDSHKALPIIRAETDTLAQTDYRPFQAFTDAPMAMTAHIVLKDVDPDQPVTLSKHAMETVVRGALGYDGLVMTDDLDMKALSGDLKSLTSRALAAGCDIGLHCNGKMRSMVQVAKGAKPLEGDALRRAQMAECFSSAPEPFSAPLALAELSALLKEPVS